MEVIFYPPPFVFSNLAQIILSSFVFVTGRLKNGEVFLETALSLSVKCLHGVKKI